MGDETSKEAVRWYVGEVSVARDRAWDWPRGVSLASGTNGSARKGD